jgi:uncharacterized protein (TIGR01777 family)
MQGDAATLLVSGADIRCKQNARGGNFLASPAVIFPDINLENTMPTEKGRRIVITGATGLIGSELVRRLSGRGDHVTVLSRDAARARRELPEAASHLAWSSSMTEGEWVGAIGEADGVINLAGAPIASRWTREQKQKIYDSRIRGTEHLVDAMRRGARAPGVLINASAVGYYGANREERVDEDSSSGTDFLAQLCVEWEAKAKEARGLGTRVVLVRTGIVLDPHEGALGKMLPPFRFFVGGPLGTGRQWFPWIHLEDEVGIILWALDTPDVEGAINAVAPEIVRNREFSTVLGKVLHRPSFLPVPKAALSLLFGEGAIVLTGGQQVIAERTGKLGYRFKFSQLRPALEDLVG